MKYRNRFWPILLLLIAMLGVACSRDEGTEAPLETATPAQRVTETLPPPSSTPTPRPTATPTVTSTPLVPAVAAIEQALDADGTVVISSATLPEAGWLVVYGDEEGEPGRVLGYTAIAAGSSRDVPVTIDPYLATDPLYVRLHQDAGAPGEFEYPGADEPLPQAEPVTASFPVDIRVTIPALTVSDQEVGRDQGEIVVERVAAPGPGWVVLYADAEGEPGKVLGQTPVRAGENKNVVIAFDWRQGTRPMYVRLYHDEGELGRFEPEPEGPDRPVIVDEAPVAASFVATLPVDVFVINQPVDSGEVYVERALTNGPGWLAVYSDYFGLTDRLLGYIHLEPGANEDLVVPLDPDGITSQLHIMIHDDAGTVGEFESPGPDTPLRREGRMQLFSFQTDAGNYLQTVDQVLAGDQVTIPLVVADLDVWLLIHADAGEELGEIIGRELLAPGVHQNVTVTIDTAAVTPILHAALRQDEEPLGEFDSAEIDIPLRYEGSFIQAPFAVEIED